MWQAEAHVYTVLFREETRWPGYYFRSDTPKIDEEKWHVFANCRCDPKTGKWDVFTKPIIRIFEDKVQQLELSSVKGRGPSFGVPARFFRDPRVSKEVPWIR